MEVMQVVRRILISHGWLIALCVFLAVDGVLVFERGQPTTYTADARLVLDTQDPTTRQEAAAIADTAKAIATSPGQVGEALRKAGVKGLDPAKVADGDITVTSLGSSGLLQLSVADRSPTRAAAIANALTNAVIQTRLESTRGGSRAVLTDLDKRLADVRARIDRLDRKSAGISTPAGGQLGAERDAAARQRQSLSTLAGVLESERISLLTVAASAPRPAVVSPATPPAHADPSDVAPHVVLGVLLGLILGIGLAALLEMVRPTVVGGDAVAREFDAPLLGTLGAKPDVEAALTDLARVRSRLALAMGGARVPSVSLFAAGPEVDLRPLAARLDSSIEPARVTEAVPVGAPTAVGSVAPGASGKPREHGSSALRVHAAANGGVPATNGHPIGGVVVVAPSSMRMSDVVDTTELVRVSSSPVVGVIAYEPPRGSGTGRLGVRR